jgi:thioredoxin reductase (NADPH)
MATPVIMTVDDEPQVLNAIERDLRQHFRNEYRIIKANSGAEALDALQRLKERATPVALLLSDQRMPGMGGTEFLDQARKIHPDAKKVLLTAYADTEAAITAINQVGLDHYLMKPWDPPEQNLFPVLDDLLSDWQLNAPRTYDGIRVAGTLWSKTSHDVKDFLARNRIPYQWLDIEKDTDARALVEAAEGGGHKLPVVFFPDGNILVEPDVRELADKAGMHTQASTTYYDVVIVGAGPAGLGAGVYAAAEGYTAAILENEATGGQAGTSSRIENYLGFPNGISGADLAQRASAQAQRLGTEILSATEAVSVRVDGQYKIVTLADGTELTCRALIIATGMSLRELNAPGVKERTGAGIYYGAALTEAAFYKDEPVFVVGGANSAGQGAMFFSRYASKVTMLVRADDLHEGMSQYLIDQIGETDNIEVILNAEVTEALGDGKLERVTYKDVKSGEQKTLEGSAMFVFIGAVPHSGIVSELVKTTEHGFILTGADLFEDGKRPAGWTEQRDPLPLETNVPGIFAAGDVRDGVVRRVASAVGEGSVSISQVHQYMQTV